MTVVDAWSGGSGKHGGNKYSQKEDNICLDDPLLLQIKEDILNTDNKIILRKSRLGHNTMRKIVLHQEVMSIIQ